MDPGKTTGSVSVPASRLLQCNCGSALAAEMLCPVPASSMVCGLAVLMQDGVWYFCSAANVCCIAIV